MSWHQAVQDFVGRWISHRLAMRIFHWRVAYFIRRGRVQSAHIVPDPAVLLAESPRPDKAQQ